MITKYRTKRLDYLDMAKGIGIILVVVGHSTFAADGLLTWIASFHMPLFFVVSGMLMQHTDEEARPITDTIKRKLKGIIIPYACFSIIYMLIDLILLWLNPESQAIVEIKRSAIETATFYGISVLWFLPALFIGEITFLFIRRKCSHMVTIIIGIIAAVVVSVVNPLFNTYYPLYKNMFLLWIGYLIIVIFRGAVAYAFLMVGYYIKKYSKEQGGGRFKELFLAVCFLLLNVAISIQNGRVDLHTLVFNQPLLYFLSAVSGSMAVILLCKNIKIWKPLKYLGVNSLIIMLTHLDCRVMITSINLALWVNQFVTRAKSYVLYLCIAVFVTVFELAIIYVVNHYFPFLIGKKPKKNRGKLKIYKETSKNN